MNVKHYFNILGISPTKDVKIIKRAFRKKALQYHPDRNSAPDAKLKFIEVTEAYDQLLLAIEQAEKQGSTVEQANDQQQSYPPTYASRSRPQEDRDERYRRARMRYQQMKRKAEEEGERYYQSLTTGKKWLTFRIIVLSCTLMSFLLTMDISVFPATIQPTYIAQSNLRIAFNKLTGGNTTPVIFDNGKKAWIPYRIVELGDTDDLYIEYTSIFDDIKSIQMWQDGRWEKYTTGYSIINTFPVIPVMLLLPLFAYLYKSRTYTFVVFYNFGYYFMPFVLLLALFSSNRWLHLLYFLFR